IENGNLVERNAFVGEFKDALSYEVSLLINVSNPQFCGFLAGRAVGPQCFRVLVLVECDGAVGELQNLRRGAVVQLKSEVPAFGVAQSELEDISVLSPAKSIDRLGIIADDH